MTVKLTCRELVDLILDYIDEALEADRKDLFDVHLTGCKNCVVYVETYRLTVKVSRALPKCGPVPPTLEQRFKAALAKNGDGKGEAATA